MQEIVSLAIPFIAIAIFASMVDSLAQALEYMFQKISGFPDYLENVTAYILVFLLSLVVCWQGEFDLFVYLNVKFQEVWQGWVMTALVISGGSSFVRYKFGLIKEIPSGVYGLTANLSNVFKNKPPQPRPSTPPETEEDRSKNTPGATI